VAIAVTRPPHSGIFLEIHASASNNKIQFSFANCSVTLNIDIFFLQTSGITWKKQGWFKIRPFSSQGNFASYRKLYCFFAVKSLLELWSLLFLQPCSQISLLHTGIRYMYIYAGKDHCITRVSFWNLWGQVIISKEAARFINMFICQNTRWMNVLYFLTHGCESVKVSWENLRSGLVLGKSKMRIFLSC
jgi:hypothetical protein